MSDALRNERPGEAFDECWRAHSHDIPHQIAGGQQARHLIGNRFRQHEVAHEIVVHQLPMAVEKNAQRHGHREIGTLFGAHGEGPFAVGFAARDVSGVSGHLFNQIRRAA